MLKDRENSGEGCARCRTKITDRWYLLAVDRQWHLGCLQCAECNLPLDAELTCFHRHGNIYCKHDYYRLFGVKRCGRCSAGISSSELVMKVRGEVYHVGCFSCVTCGVLLTKGDRFGVRDGMVYCQPHYEMTLWSEDEHPPSPWSPQGVKGRPRKRRLVSPEPSHIITQGLVSLQQHVPHSALEVSSHCGDMMSSGGETTMGFDQAGSNSPSPSFPAQQQRTKRMRTSFKHHQLRTMKSYFNINQNPDAKDLKQLAQKTGLSKRVLQVWFQNARAKWRRNLMRQEGGTVGVASLGTVTEGAGGQQDQAQLTFQDIY